LPGGGDGGDIDFCGVQICRTASVKSGQRTVERAEAIRAESKAQQSKGDSTAELERRVACVKAEQRTAEQRTAERAEAIRAESNAQAEYSAKQRGAERKARQSRCKAQQS
jgi:hypothetical protein